MIMASMKLKLLTKMSLIDRTNADQSSAIVNRFLRKIVCAGFGLAALVAGLEAARADYPSTVLSDGPFAYFRLNETYTTLPDLATNLGTIGTGGTGNYVGSVSQGVAGALVGSPDKAASFDGSGARVAVPFTPDLSLSGPFTVEAWVKPALAFASGSGTLAAVLSCGHLATDPNRSGWLIYQSETGWNLRMYTGSGSATGVSITGGPAPVTNTWYHIAAVYSGPNGPVTNAIVYVNGVLAASNIVTAFTPNSDGPFTIGTRSDIAFNYSGAVDEAVLYTNALSAAAILAHYQNGTNASPLTPYSQLVNSGNPICYYRLNELMPAAPVAANIGTLGAAANGGYYFPATNVAGPQPPDFPVFEANNNAIGLDGTAAFMRFPRTGNLTNAGLSSVTEATFLCWVNPAGPQAEYKGLVAMRPLSTGLYLNPDDTLNYAWLDAANTYGFDSGLIPPAGEWSLAAVSIQPTQAVFYLVSTNAFASATNAVSHPAADFTSGPFAVGRDINFGSAGRFFNGSIDEAAVFTTALGEGRIRTYFLTAIGDTNSPVLVSDPPSVTKSKIKRKRKEKEKKKRGIV